VGAAAGLAARPEGLDVSHFQGQIDWASVAGAGISFAFAKASEGSGYTDPEFGRNWEGMKAAGLLRGAYHYFRPQVPAVVQARHFLSLVPSLEHGDLHPMLDVEEADGMTPNLILEGVQAWIDTVRRALGREVIIYTYPYFWETAVRNSDRFVRGCPLWIASYSHPPTRPLVGGWHHYTFWQYTDKGSVPGIGGRGIVDRDRFNGSLENLRKFAGY